MNNTPPACITETAKGYHEECVSKIKKKFEESGFTVYRTGNFDILSKEEYDDDTMPLPIRLSKLSADLKAVRGDNTVYTEVKTEDIKDERGDLRLNAVQLAYFIHQFNQTGVKTMYSYFQKGKPSKCWWAHDQRLIPIPMALEGGFADSREYVESATKILKERSSNE